MADHENDCSSLLERKAPVNETPANIGTRPEQGRAAPLGGMSSFRPKAGIHVISTLRDRRLTPAYGHLQRQRKPIRESPLRHPAVQCALTPTRGHPDTGGYVDSGFRRKDEWGVPEWPEGCRNGRRGAGMTRGTRDAGMPEGMTSSLQGRDDVAHFLERWATRSSLFIIPAADSGMIHEFGGWTCQLSHHRLDRDGAACEARSSPRSVSGHSPPRSHQPSCRTFHFPPCRRATPKTCSTTSTGSSG